LTSTGTIAAGTGPSFVVVDPSGKFAYVTNGTSNNVSMYTINNRRLNVHGDNCRRNDS
jgi:DNA-binding beta-propeller fold protein YncE